MLKVYQLRLKQNTFDVTIKYKGVSVHVNFTDGNTYNGTPAKFYTEDPFKQKAIENSRMFKEKDIVLERVVDKPAPKANISQMGAAGSLASRIKPMAKTAKPAKPQDAVSGEGTAADNGDGVGSGNGAGDGAEGGGDSGEGAGTMEFQNLGEAIQYIALTWQIGVQTEAEARQVLKEHGITPRIKRG